MERNKILISLEYPRTLRKISMRSKGVINNQMNIQNINFINNLV